MAALSRRTCATAGGKQQVVGGASELGVCLHTRSAIQDRRAAHLGQRLLCEQQLIGG
jgi:hypothetical protein